MILCFAMLESPQKEQTAQSNAYTIWPAPASRRWDNDAILPSLDAIKASGATVTEVVEASLLDGLVLLPFIEAPDGERRYGVDSIKDFVIRHFGQPQS